jgi:dTDP-glucose pyrophosphorylase
MSERIKVGVIPAAGEGRRLGYLSGLIPKCLFPLYDKPIIHYVIENMIRIGVEKIVIPVHYQKNKMIEYFEYAKRDIDADIRLLELEQLPKGIALTIASARKYLDGPFMVILGDDVTITNSLRPLVDIFFESKAVAVEGIVRERDQEVLRRTCCIELNESKQISKLIEKPNDPSSALRGCGVYFFGPEIFDYISRTPTLPPRNEVEITNTIGLVAEYGRAYGEFIDGVNINVNTPEDLYHAWHEIRSWIARKQE